MTSQIQWIETCASTSSLLLQNESLLPHGAVIVARAQTAGRGQRGNSWEAEPGCNLTFSILLRPTVLTASRSFELSMIVALAIADALQPYAAGHEIEVKWPNDIYVGNRKLCGILIENAFCGNRIERSVVGIGINVNQVSFVSDAPNPISLRQLTGLEYDLHELLDRVTSRVLDNLGAYEAAPDPGFLADRYHSRLWRRSGCHLWHDCLTGETLCAGIRSVALTGHLTIDTDPPRTYAFKEISAIL